MESQPTLSPGAVTTVCRDGPLSSTIIEAVAAARGVDPLALSPLYGVIDPDAIDALGGAITVPSSEFELTFSWEDCHVRVHADGEVSVTPPEEDGANR